MTPDPTNGTHDDLPTEPEHHGPHSGSDHAEEAAAHHLSSHDLAKAHAEDLKAWSFKLALAGQFGFPWSDVHKLIGTLLAGFFVLVGARGKSGKSTFLRECFNAWVMDFKKRVLFVGTEQEAPILRLLWACLRLDTSIAAALNPSDPAHAALLHDVEYAQPNIENAHIYSVPDLTVPRFLKAIGFAKREGFDIVMLDHFHRLRTNGDAVRDRAEAAYVIKNEAVKSDILVVGAAQLKDDGEGGGLGHHTVPGSGSWAGTADLRRECDKALQLWRPLKPGLSAKQKQSARENPGGIHAIVEHNIMAVRADADRYAVTDKGGLAAKLRVQPTGRLDSLPTEEHHEGDTDRRPYPND